MNPENNKINTFMNILSQNLASNFLRILQNPFNIQSQLNNTTNIRNNQLLENFKLSNDSLIINDNNNKKDIFKIKKNKKIREKHKK